MTTDSPQDAPPPPSGDQKDHRALKAEAKAAKAYAKASRPWYKKKRFIIPAVLVVLVVVISAANAGGSKSSKQSATTGSTADKTSNPASSRLYPRRSDAQSEDQERLIGQDAKLSGYTARVVAARYTPKLSDFETAGYVVANVSVTNRDKASQPYNLFDWKLQTSNGQVVDPTFSSDSKQVQSGDLVTGGSVKGRATFEVGKAAKGQYFLLYKPDAFDAARGVWGVRL